MKKGEMVFVYGTLRKGERADLSKSFYAFGVSFLSEDKINGEMYHLGAFPGVINVPDDFDDSLPIVRGEVYLIRDTSISALLDAYEGYNSDHPTTGLYNRKETRTFIGRKAWVYTYNGLVIPEQRIESGDWRRSPLTSVAMRRRLSA